MTYLAKIRRLRGLGIFSDFNPDDRFPDLKRYNLIYGFNGTGKTTLSRVFRGLDTGRPGDALPSGADFELELSDGRVVRPDASPDALQERVLVFNVDFVNDNLKWSEGSANPVFYLGRETARDVELLRRIEAYRPIWEEQRDSARMNSEAKDKALSTFYTNTARLIAEVLEAGRKYNAHHLKQDFQSTKLRNHRVLSEPEQESRKQLIRQEAATEKVDLPAPDIEDLRTTLQAAKRACEASVARATLDELDQHPAMTAWMKSGFDYHTHHGLTECLFCGSTLAQERLHAISKALDEGIEKFFNDIDALIAKTARLQKDMQQVQQRLPRKAELTPSYASEYGQAAEKLTDALMEIETVISEACEALEAKKNSPNATTLSSVLAAESLDAKLNELEDSLTQTCGYIRAHNEEQENFETRRSKARDELKFSCILEHKAEHDGLLKEAKEAEDVYAARQALVTKARNRAQGLRTSIRDHGPAVDRINGLLRAYLGHEELQLDSFDNGYQILRNGSLIKAPLSEGERTAIALCYFLSKIEEEGRNLGSQIVVVDDPVSSLDAGALNYAFNLLKNTLQNAEQLIILTHNINFMNECRKWLKSMGKTKRSLFYVHSWIDSQHGRRKASIREMPVLLSEYDSEYQYLFSLVKLCAEEGVESENVPGHLMPNVIRRVLELFLAFKIPNGKKLKQKIEDPAVEGAGLGVSRMKAIHRLADVESHSDNIEGLIGFSSLAIEETEGAAQAVLILIEVMDRNHFQHLAELSE